MADYLWAIPLAVGVLLFGLLIGYMVSHDRTNADHLRSFTPTCPNCRKEIMARIDRDPNPRNRLRDHFKECAS